MDSRQSRLALTNWAAKIKMAKGEIMKRFRKIATFVLVWATASSTLIAATPYYVCRCPDGTIKTHFIDAVAPESSCCSSNCCAASPKEKPCCQAAKKKQVVKPARDTKPSAGHRQDYGANGPSISQVPCQKTLVQPEGRSICRVEANPTETDLVVALLPPVLPGPSAMHEAEGGTALWRIDKAPPPTDLVTVFQRLTI